MLTRSVSTRNALVVDDGPVERLAGKSMLEKLGFDVTPAASGEEALDRLAESNYDLILCDINMPIMDGLEFVKQLADVPNAKGVPVVMITTEGSEAHVVQAISCGAKGYIRKPFTAEQVKEHVIPVLAAKS